jgi:hypothetical protein
MRRLYNTVVQLEESKRFILAGSIAHLRLALILLDNAIEVMMFRVLEDDLRRGNAYLRMLERFPPGPLDPKGEELRKKSNRRPSLQKDRRKSTDSSVPRSRFLARIAIAFPERLLRQLNTSTIIATRHITKMKFASSHFGRRHWFYSTLRVTCLCGLSQA